MKSLTCAFIGLGLIGGSIAKSLKQHYPALTIMAYDSNTTATIQAKVDGMVDLVLTNLDDTTIHEGKTTYCLSLCDIIFLCAPVSINNDNLVSIQNLITKETIITDVGSVKSGIHEQVTALGLEDQFIGGHPMTGSEKSGFAHAQAIILENAYYILTPTASVSSDKVSLLRDLIKGTGALPVILDAQNHDYVTAAISHVPHLIAAALVNLVKDSDHTTDGYMKMLAAGGFKDITRIASSSPEMWEAICMANPDNISKLLGKYISALEDIKNSIGSRNGQDIYQLFDVSRTYRDSFDDLAKGPIKKTYVCYVDIPDETGSIATLATILASHTISMKNIGIIHNREFEEGVLRIEFYDEASKKDAVSLLQKLQYTIFDRK